MKQFVVFHNYGAYEGWRIVAEAETLAEAVDAREHELQHMGGGTVEIFQHFEPTTAYAMAHSEPGLPGQVEQT